MSTSIHDILDQLRSVAYDERDKGSRFERLMRAYLSTEPQFVDLYDEVWLWNDYPRRDGRTDTGIDLVARTRATGEYAAIQCKFFDPSTTVTKPMLDSFLSASSKSYDGKPEFTARMVISTSDTWGKNAEEAVESQNPPVSRLRAQDLDDSSIDWNQFSLAAPGELVKKPHKIPFPHQEKAIKNVLQGFVGADRGKLIMACGTGKTYTSLQIVERMVPKGGSVLFLVPSIALLGQTLKEWTIEASLPIRSFAVCSDVSVGKRTDEEDTPVVDLAYPATTNTARLVAKYKVEPDDPDTITIVFSTYQSIDVVAQAQRDGLPEFDLIVCDEAHRTTGVTLANAEESTFVRVHDQGYLKGKKRLYMTATPRIYADSSRAKAEEAGAVLSDMNDPALYGQEFHRLSFGEAVSIGRLTDYKVLVLAVDETYVSKRFQRLLADDNNELTLDDAAKIVGCWNGLSKRALTKDEFRLDPAPMKRAVAFARNIKESKKIADLFEYVVDAEIAAIDAETDENADDLLDVAVHHVDGTYNVLRRNEELDWLKQEAGEGNARVLTNARCLSEGVDVPSLDAVMFLNPRDSVVDVVQSVGRVMRRLEGKNYGYVILPIGVPSDVDPAEALNDNKKYRVVWQVLQALRAHDERFDAEVNKIDLTGKTEKLQIGIIGKGGSGRAGDKSEADYGSVTLDFPEFDKWRDAILAKIVDKVGERRYWENWARDVVGIAEDHIARITALVQGSDAELRTEFSRFLKGLQDNLNPYTTERDAIEMLSQHLITKPVFDALFQGYAFSEHNPVSLVMQGMVDALEGQNLEKETERLDKFYDSVRTRAAGIEDADAKQTIVKELYERFFRTAFSGTSDRLGIVYTPNEIVDFIVRSVDDALRSEYGSSISAPGVHLLDPFTGTGTFIVRLMQSGLIRPEDLARKYRYELHANELVLLAYYVAAINIEATYHALSGEEGYEPFDGIVLTDTFQMSEADDVDELEGMAVFPENNERVEAQKALDIQVVLGNPPWSVGQDSGNDATSEVRYPTLDERVRSTYSAERGRGGNNAVYDSYIRAIRWASDRIGDRGIVAYVSNGGFIDGSTASEMRRRLVAEFNSIYVLNLRGNTRTSGEEARREGGQTFGSGSRATVAIFLLIKNPDAPAGGRLFYHDIGDYQTRDQKLESVKRFESYRNVPWVELEPDEHGDWINQRSSDFLSFMPIGTKRAEDAGITTIVHTYSRGLETGRDAWVYNFSDSKLEENVRRLARNYNELVAEAEAYQRENPGVTRKQAADAVIDLDGAKISWTLSLKNRLAAGKRVSVDKGRITRALYRPFNAEFVYYDRQLNHILGRLPVTHPDPATENWGFVLTSPSSHFPNFAALATNAIPDLHMLDTGQFFPRYTFDEGAEEADLFSALRESDSAVGRVDNVTDEALAEFRSRYGEAVTKDDIFFYVYGLLQSPQYIQQYAPELKKMLPRLPMVTAFRQFAEAGRSLAALHLDYERAEPFELVETWTGPESYRVQQMRYGKNGRETDKSTIIYNAGLTLSGIPVEAQEYLIGSRSALDWLLERYRTRVDKDSGLVNDPNDWMAAVDDQRYLVDLIRRVVTVSVRTIAIVKSLPPLDVAGS